MNLQDRYCTSCLS